METVGSELVFVMSCLHRYEGILRSAMNANARLIGDLSMINSNKPEYGKLIRHMARDFREEEARKIERMLLDKERFVKDISLISAAKSSDSVQRNMYKFNMYKTRFERLMNAFQKQSDLTAIKKEICERRNDPDGVTAWTRVHNLILHEKEFTNTTYNRVSSILN